MKNSKKGFVLLEMALGILVFIMIVVMIEENSERDMKKVSVIVQNSDDRQWSAFKYGLRMAAEDQGVELVIVSTAEVLTTDEERSLIAQEVENGADALIVQPVAENDVEGMLEEIGDKVPVILTGCSLHDNKQKSMSVVVERDNYAMGQSLAEEILKDRGGDIADKTIGILSDAQETEEIREREQGFMDAIEDSGAEIRWRILESFEYGRAYPIESLAKADIVVALDDSSLSSAGNAAASNNLHGAVVYGIGHSTEAFYYLDTGMVKCIIVPDEFQAGYLSLTETAKDLNALWYRMKKHEISYKIIRQEDLFTKENQEILYTMSQ